jgi:trehalose utilization protein
MKPGCRMFWSPLAIMMFTWFSAGEVYRFLLKFAHGIDPLLKENKDCSYHFKHISIIA